MATDAGTLSDDESFVILGSSPLNSLTNPEPETQHSSFNSLCESQVATKLSADLAEVDNIDAVEKNSDVSSKEYSLKTVDGPLNSTAKLVDTDVPKVEMELNKSTASTISFSDLNGASNVLGSDSSAKSSIRSAGAPEASLAASFILGEIDADVLKQTSIYSQFPSMTSMQACAEDMIKLQTFMTEYAELKLTLVKVNSTMKQFYLQTQKWRDEMATMKENHQEKMNEFQFEIATLRNENHQLKNEVNTKIKQIQICEEMRRQDHAEMVQTISAKTAQIDNMRAVIEKIEKEQLASFECISNFVSDTKKKSDFIDTEEHQRVVKDFERSASRMLAENLELKDMQRQYIDEITCLKVNLTAAEELLNQTRVDISLLKATDAVHGTAFNEYQTDRDKMRDEIALLRQQVEIYSKDFEMERAARQTLAGEKDQLLLNLRSIQQKNQKLIEEEQLRLQQIEQNDVAVAVSATSATGAIPKKNTKYTAVTMTNSVSEAQRPIRTLPPTSAAATMSPAQNDVPNSMQCCPICFKTFKTLTDLHNHVNECLDKSSS